MAKDAIEQYLESEFKKRNWHLGDITKIPGTLPELLGKPTHMSPVILKLLDKFGKALIQDGKIDKRGLKKLQKGIKKYIVKGKYDSSTQRNWLNDMAKDNPNLFTKPDISGRNRNPIGDFLWMMRVKSNKGQLLSKLKTPTINFGDKSSGITWGKGVQVASSDLTSNLGTDWSKQFSAPSGQPVSGPHIGYGNGQQQPVTKPSAPPGQPVSGPHKTYQDTAQDRQEQREKERQVQQETAKYKDTATTGAKAGYTYGLQSGGRIKRKIKKVKSKYAKGGGVRTSKYVL
jgi:hypothetical protein